jgi:ABC-type glycerol-3-phosphate transport system substrate-binding protein
MDDELNNGSTMDEAVYARQERVRKYLGVEFSYVDYPDAEYNTYQTYIQAAVQNKDGTVDALVTHVHGGVSNLISENLLVDLGDFEGIDLDAEYWHKEFMETLELNGNYFLGHSDYNIMQTCIIAYNKELLDQYGAALDKSVYDLVRDYEWTLEEMANLARLISVDVTGDGESIDDYFGFTGTTMVFFNGFLTSSNIPMVAQTQSGAYEVAISKSEYFAKTDDLVEFFRELDDSSYTYFTYSIHDDVRVLLSSGRVLMQTMYTDDLQGLLNYDIEFGVLPYPLYDREQASVGYKSLQWGGYLGILSYTRNPVMVGETLEMLAYYSENVKITYYEKVLGKRIADMPDDAEMLELVWGAITTDVGQTFYNLGGDETGVCYTLHHLIQDRSKNLSSYIATKEKAINNGFKKFLDGIEG